MGPFQIRNSSDQGNCCLVSFHFYRWWLMLQLMIVVDFCSLHQCLEYWSGIFSLQSSQHIGPIGISSVTDGISGNAISDTQFNSCCWLLLTRPWFALSKWLVSASHPPVFVWEQATLSPLGSPSAPPFLLLYLTVICGATKWQYFSVVWEWQWRLTQNAHHGVCESCCYEENSCCYWLQILKQSESFKANEDPKLISRKLSGQ